MSIDIDKPRGYLYWLNRLLGDVGPAYTRIHRGYIIALLLIANIAEGVKMSCLIHNVQYVQIN